MNKYQILSTFLVALSSLLPIQTFAQSCGSFSAYGPSSGSYSVGDNYTHNFDSNFTLTNTKAGQQLSYYYTRNGVEVGGSRQTITIVTPQDYEGNHHYELPLMPANTTHAGDYRLVVESSCPTGAPCTCVQNFSGPVTYLSVSPVITVQPAHQMANKDGMVTFNVTATGSNLRYQWFRKDDSGDVSLGAPSAVSSKSVTLDSLSKADEYYVKVTHTNIGSAYSSDQYGYRSSSEAILAMNTTEASLVSDGVCTAVSPVTGLSISPEDLRGDGYYHLTEGQDLVLRYATFDNGIGNCSDYSYYYGGNVFRCTDSARTGGANGSQTFYINPNLDSILESSYHYEKDGVLISGSDSTTINTSGYYDLEALYVPNVTIDPEADTYRLKVTDAPCGLPNPTTSEEYPVVVDGAQISFTNLYMYHYDADGNFLRTISDFSSPVVALTKQGLYFYSSATLSGGGSVYYQWQKYDSISMQYEDIAGATSSSFYIYEDSYIPPGLEFSDAGQYRVKACDAPCSGASIFTYSDTITVDVNPPAVASVQIGDMLTVPEGTLVAIPAPIIMPLDAKLGSGEEAIEYQWERSINGGQSWEAVATTAGYTFTASLGNYLIKAKARNISNLPGEWIESQNLALTVEAAPPEIQYPPLSQSVEDGQPAVFVVGATGSLPLSYQWQRSSDGGANWNNVGTNNSAYSFNAQLADDGDLIRVVVTNAQGSEPSTEATLTVTPRLPTILDQPDSTSVSDGQVASFSVAADGTAPLSYQWELSTDGGANFLPIAGATSPVLAFAANISQNQYQYRVVVTNAGGSAPSMPAVLTVNAAEPSIITPPESRTVFDGDPAVFFVAASGTAPLTYQWELSTDDGANFLPIAGATSSSLALSTSLAMDGYQYRVVVNNPSMNPATSTPATLTVNAAAPMVLVDPQNTTVDDFEFAGFYVISGGSAPFSYQWHRSTDGGVSFTPIMGATSATYSFQASYSMNGHKFKVVVTNSAGEDESLVATLTVNAIAPTIQTDPGNRTVDEGQAAQFTVIASGTTPLSYQWERSMNAGANWTEIPGATASTYTLVNPQYSSDNNAWFRAKVTNIANPTGVYSNHAILTVNEPACTAPSAPSLTAPLNGLTNVSLLPTLSWNAVSSNPYCPIEYEVRLCRDLNCDQADVAQIIPGTTLNISGYLLPETNYYWKVRARTTGVNSDWSTIWYFRTTTDEIPVPNGLYTLPSTTPSIPSGTRYILIGAYNGEPGATGLFYQKRPEGDVLVGQVVIPTNPTGQFQTNVDVGQVSNDAGQREYYARIQRPGQQELGGPSVPVSYFYDPALAPTIAAPVLEKDGSTLGHLKWEPVPTATSYKVWRRIGLEVPDSNRYLDVKPFKLVATLNNPTPVGGFIKWEETEVFTIPQAGVSYFVTAYSDTQTSSRSNSQSFADEIGPVRNSLQQVQFFSLPSGRSAIGFLCNINADGYFGGADNGENSPDVFARTQVKVKAAQTPCSEEDYDENSVSYVLPFDAIKSYTNPTYGVVNCLQVGEVGNLEPETTYCMKTCLKGASNDAELNCLEGRQIEVGPDIQAPDFAGVKSATPLEDGKSIKVEWDPPTFQSFIQEPINYTIQYTEQFDEGGQPIFPQGGPSRVAGPTALDITVDQLKTGNPYCFKVTVFDDQGNSADGDRELCSQTLDNAPTLDGIALEKDPENPYKLLISFRVIDRVAGDGIVIKKMSFRNAENTAWIEMNSKHFTGNSFMASGDSVSNAPIHTVTADTLPYFSGQRDGFQIQFDVEDSEGNAKTIQTLPLTIFQTQSRSSNYARLGYGNGCGGGKGSSIRAEGSEASPWNLLFFVGSILCLIFVLRRNSRPLRN